MNYVHEHSFQKSVLLHLLPGLLTGLVYYALAPVVRSFGFPTVMALILAGILALIPFELGYLLFQKKKTGKPFFNGLIRYCDPIPARAYLVWVPAIFLTSGALFTLFNFSSDFLMPLFSWIPENLHLEMGLDGEYSKENLMVTSILFFVFVVVILPVTEELYFRGYLLPRMPGKLKGWTPIVHSALFALYHVWTPWMLITRTVAVLPLIYGVQKKKNILLGIIVHCLLNTIDLIVGLSFISNM
jgi:uncharacterized protein